ncbi:hypothetical protein THAOC_24095, partial [Thalassiosira oceanica]
MKNRDKVWKAREKENSMAPGRMSKDPMCRDYDFTWLASEDPHWKAQNTIPTSHVRAMLSALFFYKMNAPDVMRFLGGTYTGEY